MRYLTLVMAMLLAPNILPHVCAASRKPNVVILFTDDQGTLDANCFGATDLHTPNIDRLAQDGIRFTQAYAHTVCCPSRAALMTGRHPQRCNVNNWTQSRIHDETGRNMFLSEVTLAETLRAAGYHTALFGKWHLGAHPDHGPTKQGFDEFFGIRGGFIDNYTQYHLHRQGGHDLFEGTKEVFARNSYFPDLITDRALSFIEAHKEEPFFLYYALNLPHYPEQMLERFNALYKDLKQPRRTYAATVTTADHYIGRILNALETFGLYENTIIVFMSDNGHSEEDYKIQGAHHLSGLPEGTNYGSNAGGGYTGKWIGAKSSFLEGGIRTPAILSWPAQLPKNIVRDQAVSIMDWYPTILDLLELSQPQNVQFDGRTLKDVIAKVDAPSPHPVMVWQWQNAWAVREGDWKLIANGHHGAKGPKLDKLHLGNLGGDHPEQTNHAAEHPEIVKRLTSLHEVWLKDVTPESGL